MDANARIAQQQKNIRKNICNKIRARKINEHILKFGDDAKFTLLLHLLPCTRIMRVHCAYLLLEYKNIYLSSHCSSILIHLKISERSWKYVFSFDAATI